MAVYGDPPPCPVCLKWHFPQCAEPCGTCKPLADRVATLETALREISRATTDGWAEHIADAALAGSEEASA